MRYNDIIEDINPGEKKDSKAHFMVLWKKILHDCSDFMNVAGKDPRSGKHNFLYRGIKTSGLNRAFIGKPREDRQPLSGDPEQQEFANKGLAMLGFKTNRSNSIAVSTNYFVANGYGKVYLIFPKNGFSFLTGNRSDLLPMARCNQIFNWFEKYHSDELIYGRSIEEMSFYNVDDESILMKWLEEHPVSMKEFWEYSKYLYALTDTDIQTSLNKGYEIMISGAEYYALEYRFAVGRLKKMGYNIYEI